MRTDDNIERQLRNHVLAYLNNQVPLQLRAKTFRHDTQMYNLRQGITNQMLEDTHRG